MGGVGVMSSAKHNSLKAYTHPKLFRCNLVSGTFNSCSTPIWMESSFAWKTCSFDLRTCKLILLSSFDQVRLLDPLTQLLSPMKVSYILTNFVGCLVIAKNDQKI